MKRPSQAEILLFFTMLRAVVTRKLPLAEGLRRLSLDGGIARDVLEEMAGELEDGVPLSKAVEARSHLFPSQSGALLAAGEQTGELLGAVEQCRELVRSRLRTIRHLQAALIYPAICLSLVLGLAALGAFLNPLQAVAKVLGTVYGPVLSGEISTATEARYLVPLPMRMSLAITRVYAFIGDLLFWNPLSRVLILIGLGLLAAFVWKLFCGRDRTPRYDRLLLNLPLVGRLYRWDSAASFTRTLGALLSRGVAVDRATQAAIPAAGNTWVEHQLRRRLAGIRDGESLAEALSLPGIFPPSLMWRLSVGQERGDLGRALTEAAESYEQSLEVYSLRLARTAEPAALILVGIAALLILGGALGPMTSLWAASHTFDFVF